MDVYAQLLLAWFTFMIIGVATPGFADQGEASSLNEIARAAVVHVSVTGKLLSDPTTPIVRSGKAFAVGPNLLVTSQHLLGYPNEWVETDGSSQAVKRLVRPLVRTISLRTAAGQEIADAIEVPSAHVTDAAGISIASRRFEHYFRLSMCEIAETQIYTAIMTVAVSPGDPDSISDMTPVALRPAKPSPTEFGPLIVFDPVDPPQFHVDTTTGHDGSPILDKDGAVVALISAIIKGPGGGSRILATPMQPLFPVASAVLALAPASDGSADVSLKCSLSDTVKRINDQMIAHATWSVNLERDADGLPEENLYLRYESVADKPSITQILIEYQYVGPQRKGETARRLSYKGPTGDYNDVPLVPSGGWKFSLRDVVTEGKDEVEKFLLEKGGSIERVEVRIYEIWLSDGRKLPKDIVLQFRWREPK